MSDQKNIKPIQSTQTGLTKNSPADSAGHNALLSAAAAILTQSNHLRKQWPDNSVITAQTHLINLVEQFMRDGQAASYSAPILLASRYFLCATLDEIIASSSWVEKDAWDEVALLRFFKQEPSNSNRFFLILQRSCENPEEHIDLIELGFHCLSIGFMGDYKDKVNGTEIITKLMDKLYQIIIEVRGEAPTDLFLGSKLPIKVKAKRFGWSSKPRWAAVIWGACIVIFLGVLFPYKAKLDTLAAPTHQELQSLTQSSQQGGQNGQ